MLWLGTGGGLLICTPRSQALHWGLLGWFVRGLAAAGRRTLDIDVVPDLSIEAAPALASDRPLIVLSRHAGPGDTIFIVDELMSRFHRRPSVVFKESLTLDPCIDLLGRRLPHAVLDRSDRDESEEIIARVTTDLGPRGTLLLFPEGGNFTPERRRSALLRLRRRGKERSVEKAESMPHVFPPQPSGTLAALHARQTDIVFAAHTGLGLAAYPGQFWREMPIGGTLHTRMWVVPASDVPAGDKDQIDGSTTGGSGSTSGSRRGTRGRRRVTAAARRLDAQAAAACSGDPNVEADSGDRDHKPIHLLNASGGSGFEKWKPCARSQPSVASR